MKAKYEISKRYIKSAINTTVDYSCGDYKGHCESLQDLMVVLDEVKMCLSKKEEDTLLEITKQKISECFPTERWTDENPTLNEIVNEFVKTIENQEK